MTDYCFCLENSESGNLFQLDCDHSFHQICMRKLLCHRWIESPRPRTVDVDLRKVVDLPCPLCRMPVSPTKLRDLQKMCKIITVHMLVEEDPLREYFYIVTVRNNQNHLIHKKYLSKDLPVIASVSPDCVHKLLYEDYIVTADSPLTSFKLKVRRRQRHPESSAVEVLNNVKAIAKELPSFKPDAAEEDCRRILEDCFSRNDLRTISCEAQDQAFETFKNSVTRTTDSPPLPSLEDIFAGVNFRREPAAGPVDPTPGPVDPTPGPIVSNPTPRPIVSNPTPGPIVSNPTPGPSRMSEERPHYRGVGWRQVKLEEKSARERKVMRKKENNYENKIYGSIAASAKQLNALYKNIDKWRIIRDNLYIQNNTGTERQTAHIRNEQVITQMSKVQRELEILKQSFS